MDNTLKAQLAGKKILFATVPGDGHVNPLTGLARYLKDEGGCDVRWYTSPIFAKKMDKLGIPFYPFVSALDVNGSNIDSVFPERIALTDPGQKLNFDIINIFSNRGPEYYADIQEIYRTFPFDVMVADSIFTGMPYVRQLMGIPVIAIGIVPLPAYSPDLPPYGLAMHPPKSMAEKEKIAGLHAHMGNVFKEAQAVYTSLLAEHGIIVPDVSMTNHLIEQADFFLQIGSPSFEYSRTEIPDQVRFIGALFPYSDSKSGKWHHPLLEKYSKAILVTQGTVEKDTSKLIEPTLQAFSHTDVLVIVTTGGSDTAELREKYTAQNVIIEDYIPFEDVMPMVDVYVTNGGYGGTLLSIKHELPVVAGGLHEGKNEVCARIGYFEIGVDMRTETPTAEQVLIAVNEVLNNNKYKDNVSRLMEELRGYPSLELSAMYICTLMAAGVAV